MARDGRAMRTNDWLLLIALAIISGSSFVFIRVAVRDLPILTVVLGRVGLAAIALNLVLRGGGERLPRDRRLWRDFLAIGALGQVAPIGLLVWSETRIAGGLTSILAATVPLFAMLAAWLGGEGAHLTRRHLVGVLVGFAGTAIVIGPGALHAIGAGGGKVPAEAGVLLGALCSALAARFGRRFRGLPPLLPATGQATGATLILLPIAPLLERPWTRGMPSAEAIAAVAGLALLCTAVAFVLYYRLLHSVGATNLSLVALLGPVAALTLGAVMLGERLAAGQYAGMAVILAGLAVIDGRPAAALARRFAPGSVPLRAGSRT